MSGFFRAAATAAAAALLSLACAASAQELKLGYVSSERILRDSAPAKAATQKLEAEFSKRDRELQDMGAKLKAAADRFEKDAPVLSESDRARRQRELAEMDRDLQRRQREFREDLNQRRNEELAQVIEQANRVIRQLAEQEKYDIIFQDAVYANPRIDLTDKVIKYLEGSKPPAGK